MNNENSLSLLLSALLLLPPGDSASTLAVKMILFECAVLFLALYFLSLFGAGLLPLSFVSIAAFKSLSAQLQPAAISQYPMMSILLLFTSALLALLWPAVGRGKPCVLPLAGVAVGLVLGFVYNWRTPYGLIMAVQVAVFLFIAALKYYRQGSHFAQNRRYFWRCLRRVPCVSGSVDLAAREGHPVQLQPSPDMASDRPRARRPAKPIG